VPPDDFREGILRLVPCVLSQQFQITCHAFESISARDAGIRQNNRWPCASTFTFVCRSRILSAA
jgi:hypothetical protein